MIEFNGLYEFNEHGLSSFTKVFSGEAPDSGLDPTSAELASRLENTKSFAPTKFETSKDMADAILHSLGDGNDPLKLLPNRGLWAWLAFVLRDQLSKKVADGTWEPGNIHRWYPSDPNDFQMSKRHLVRMPVLLRRRFQWRVDHLLCDPPNQMTRIREQLTSQQAMLTPVFQEVARALYFDDEAGTLKPGARGDDAGTSPRLARVRKQLDVTWDLEDLSPERILEMLPKEFDRFKPESTTDPA